MYVTLNIYYIMILLNLYLYKKNYRYGFIGNGFGENIKKKLWLKFYIHIILIIVDT